MESKEPAPAQEDGGEQDRHFDSDSQEWNEHLSPMYGSSRDVVSRNHVENTRRPPESVAVDEVGYQSAGALSDGPTVGPANEQSYSSVRSVGSVGSQGSGERFVAQGSSSRYDGGQTSRDSFSAQLMNGETRFPTAWSYAASEACKSDIATVCSGSVVEDIEVASMLSAEMNTPQTPSTDKSIVASTRRTGSGGRVEFATIAKHTDLPTLPSWQVVAARSSPQPPAEGSLMAINVMGPPLSRALLRYGSSSQCGSVKSFESKGSDVIAQVDTDDCGGSLVESITDGYSVNSQEDANPAGYAAAAAAASLGDIAHVDQGDCSESAPEQHFLQQTANGRTSPGGTVYKGRGVRRYQGRYMHLPLKRFHQNGVNVKDVRDSLTSHPLPTPRDDHYPHVVDGRQGQRAEEPRHSYRNRSPSPPNARRSGRYSPAERRKGRSEENQSRRRSRSRSRSPTSLSTRNHSRSPNRSRRQSPRRGFRRSGGSSNVNGSRSPNRSSRHTSASHARGDWNARAYGGSNYIDDSYSTRRSPPRKHRNGGRYY